MTRNIAVLMIGIVFFNLSVYCFPQSIDVESQAKADAEMEVNEAAWILLGAMVPIGCFVGYAVATAIDPKPAVSHYITYEFPDANETQCTGAQIGGVIGLLSLPMAYALMPINPKPEHLLGKPPEYVKAYTRIYTRETRSRRAKAATMGLGVGAGVGCMVTYIMFRSYFN